MNSGEETLVEGSRSGTTRPDAGKEWINLSAALYRLGQGYGLTERERKERAEDMARVRTRLTLALDREATFVSVLIETYLFFCNMGSMSAEQVGKTKERLVKAIGEVVSVEVPLAYEAAVAVLREFVASVAMKSCTCPVVAGCTTADPKCDPAEAKGIVRDDAISGVEILANIRSLEEKRRDLAREVAQDGHTIKDLRKQVEEGITRIERARTLAIGHSSSILTCPCGPRFREIWSCLTSTGVLTTEPLTAFPATVLVEAEPVGP